MARARQPGYHPAMDRRQLLGVGAALLGVSAVGYALFSPVSDEEMISDVLTDLGLALSFSAPISNPLFFGSALSEKFEDIFTEHVQIRVSEVSGAIPNLRGKLGLAAAQVLSHYGSMSVSFSVDELKVSGDTAHCETTASLRANQSGELRADSRPVVFSFSKEDGDWRIQSARVRAPD